MRPSVIQYSLAASSGGTQTFEVDIEPSGRRSSTSNESGLSMRIPSPPGDRRFIRTMFPQTTLPLRTWLIRFVCPAICGGADLSDAGLGGAVLTDVDLTGTKLVRTTVTDTQLADASFDYRIPNENVSPANIISEADLTDTDLSSADLSGVNVRGADVRGARIGTHKILFDSDLEALGAVVEKEE